MGFFQGLSKCFRQGLVKVSIASEFGDVRFRVLKLRVPGFCREETPQ